MLVPNAAVDYDYGMANHIGEEADQWASCFRCGQAYGQCLAVAGGRPYDQFSAWRGRSVASYMSAPSPCTFASTEMQHKLRVQRNLRWHGHLVNSRPG